MIITKRIIPDLLAANPRMGVPVLVHSALCTDDDCTRMHAECTHFLPLDECDACKGAVLAEAPTSDRAGKALRIGSVVRVWPNPRETTLDYDAVVVSFDASEGSQAVLQPQLEIMRRYFEGVAHLPTNLDRCERLRY